jgi:hypothetical protein
MLCLWSASQSQAGGEVPIDFQRQIRPILAAHCINCHGPDEAHRQAELRLDRRDGLFDQSTSGVYPVIPKHPDQSELFRRITAADPAERMPPSDSGLQLTPAQIELIRQWIAQGAPWSQHWSLVSPQHGALPGVQRTDWPRNSIDSFILARIEQAGLEPSPEANRYQLIRRLSLDLRGLPPTLDEVDLFLHDSGSDAYERLVDRFLADPAYGERWARLWLDLARYADSAGYGSDPLREIWLYRDWVIQALNRNLPFDQFTRLQLAGDLVPNPTTDDLVATAFHRNTMTNTEGGTDDEEYRTAAVIDRVDTTGQVWLGLTVGCAKCHSHKFDPISHAEYYQLFAFFNQSADADLPNESPTIEVPSAELTAQRAAIDAQAEALRRQLNQAPLDIESQWQAWEHELRKAKQPAIDKLPLDLVAVLDLPANQRNEAQQNQLKAYFRQRAAELAPLRNQIAELEKSKPAIPRVPVMNEIPSDKQRVSHILKLANFLTPGDKVTAATPTALHDWPAQAPKNRLGLADWLMDPANPLTARVTVNRFWAALFGTGLVETEEDFGLQGEPPSHPELLDWLAIDFRAHGWDMKHLVRQIVTSATYRQSSQVTPERLERDPRNRLLSRAPRLRLEAEMVRDQALALSGLLRRKMLGPSVYPPQPDGLWQAAFNGQRTWATSTGEDRYRRGLYTFWRRTVPYPSMATFDAPSREICSVRRARTSTPLQALVTLNDPVYIESAQGLARRILKEGGDTDQSRLAYAWRLCLARPSRDAEIAPLLDLVHAELERFRQDGSAAVKVATDPIGPLPPGIDSAEAAAWTVVANVLLNLDSVLTKG